MKKRLLSAFMALTLCLTLLPAPAWAAEADAPEGGTIVQEEQQEKAPAAESPAILEQAAENGIAAQNGEDGVSVQSGGDGIAVQAASAEKTENSVASVVIDGTTSYYDTLREAIMAAGEKAGSDGTPPTITLLQNGVELRYPQYNSAEKRDDPTYPVIVDMGGNSLSSVYFLYDTLTLTGGTVNGTWGADLRSGGNLIMTAPADADTAINGLLRVASVGSGTASVSGANIGVKGTLHINTSAANAVVISGSEKAVELSAAASLADNCRLYGSTEVNGSPDTVAVFDAAQKTYTVDGKVAKTLVSGPKAVVAVTPGDTLSVMAGEAQEYTAQFTAEGVVSGSVKGLGDLRATVENGGANGITVNVAENAADGTWKVTVQTAESTPLGTYTLNLSSAVDGAVSGSVTFTVSKTQYAASVNGTNYRSLSAAVDAAKNVNGTVTLLDNVTDSITVTDGTFTIDLNGKTWSGTSSSYALTVNGGELTVSSTGGAGTIVSSFGNKHAIWINGGTVHLKENVNLKERLFIKDENGGSVTFEPGVTVTENIMTDSHSVVHFLDGLALMDLSKTGYVPFYNRNTNSEPFSGVTVVDHPAHHMVDGVCNQCGYVCGHSNAEAKDTVCPDCGAAFIAAATAADGTVTRYTNADAALAAAAGNAKVTFVSGTYTLKNMTRLYGSAEIDLQGATLQYASDYNGAVLWMEDNSVSATIKNGIIQNIGKGTGIYLYRGSTLTLENVTVIGGMDTFNTRQAAVYVANYGNTLTVKSGSFSGPLNLKLANNTVKLYGGTYQNGIKTYDKTAKDYAALLDNSDPAKQYAYADGAGSVITYDEVATRMNDSDSTNNSIQVKEHTHTMGGTNTCTQCGFVCTAHQYKNGVCAICQAACPHTDAACNAEVWTCNACGLTMVAAVTVKDSENNDVTTYAADLPAAMRAATDNSATVTLLADIKWGVTPQSRAEITGDGKIVTLDLNGHTITGGWIDIGDNNNPTSCTLKIIGEGGHESLGGMGGYSGVSPKATLDLSEWEGGTINAINISDDSRYEAATREAAVIVGPKAGTIGKLTFGNNQLSELKKTKLSGGSFHEILVANHQPVKLGDLLVSGYALQHDDGSYEQHTRTLQNESIYNVKVVKCLHPTMKPDATGVATCEYCGKSGKFAASVDGNLYTADQWKDAFKVWLGDAEDEKANGILKLYTDYEAEASDATWSVGYRPNNNTLDLNGHKMSVRNGGAFKPTNNMHLTVTDGTEIGQIENILLDGNQGGSFTLESGYVGNLEMTGGAVVALKGGSLGKLNIEDWAEGMHVSATGGSLGAYDLPSGKILADVLDHQYYAKGTSLDRQVDTAQKPEKFVIKQAPYDFGSTSKTAKVPINGSIPFMVDSPSENVGVYDVKWYRRTDSGAEHMMENRVDGVKVGDRLDVFCVITGVDRPGGEMQWQVAVKDYTINVVPANLNGDRTVITQKPNTGNTGNPADNRLVVTPFSSGAFSDVEYQFDVTYNGQPLELDKDYTIKDSSNRAMKAGTHTLTIEGMGNYTGKKSVTWTLEPYELSVENFCYAQINKTYDGTDAVTDITNGINMLDGFNLDSKNPRNPILSTVDKLNLDKRDYELSNMEFDSAEAGDRTFTGTMTLKPDGNFVFAGGSRVMQIEYGSVSGQQFVSISRAIIAAPAAKALQVANNHAATYTVDLSALLPALEAPRKYGAVTYGEPTVSLSGGYYTDGAKVENGKLILPIQAVQTDKTGSIGSVQVKVSTTNYHDFTLTINVNATNKIIPTGEPTLSTKTLTYGQALSAIKLSGTMKDDGETVPGMFAWVDGTVKPEVGSGTYEAAWKFTPTDGNTYAEADGTVTITVNKATPTGTPKYTAISKEGQTLADANLTAAGENKESLFKALGTAIQGSVKWVESEDKTTALNLGTKVEQGKAYTWLFTPNDLANYNKLTGTIVLWAKPTSGGGGGVVTPAPTPSDADVITVKEDMKDNTTSKPGAETDTTTITKTTVKNTTTETTKNEQGQDVSKTTASVSKDLGDKLLDQAVSNKSDTIEITVKSSDANNGSGAGSTGAADSVKATEVELPKATVNAIAKDTNADLVIKTDNGEVVLDNKTLETIAGAAKGDTVTIVVGENTQLKETQKPAEKIVGKNGTLFDLVAKIGEKHLHQFEGGKAYVILPMPDKLKGKDILVIYIDDNGLCKILNHSVEKIGAEDYIRFTTTHFSTFAVVDKDEAEGLIKEQNAAHVKELMQSAKFKVTTTKTSKKSVKVQVAAKSSKTMISDIKSLGYTVKYQFYRSTKKDAGYKLLKTSSKNSFISTKGTKGRKYYYKARVLVYDGSELVAGSALKQCSYGARR